jgi:F-type H+-transporting ATPase subunit gamma
MANLKEIRTRIASVQSTKQITSAMKMVSAAKLKKAQDAIMQLRPYADKLHEILSRLNGNIDSSDNTYGIERNARNVLIVLVTSNRGLCGSFNSNAIKMALTLAHEKYGNLLRNDKVKFIAIGKKGHDYLKSRNYSIIGNHSYLFEKLTFTKVADVADSVMNLYVGGQFDRVFLIYNQFKNAGVQILTQEQFLPIVKEKKETHSEASSKVISMQTDYIYEPSQELIVKNLIPKSLKIQFFKALLDSCASEHGARMTAMHKATDNATDLVRELTLNYNKARQAAITNEILEIVSGAEALKG